METKNEKEVMITMKSKEELIAEAKHTQKWLIDSIEKYWQVVHDLKKPNPVIEVAHFRHNDKYNPTIPKIEVIYNDGDETSVFLWMQPIDMLINQLFEETNQIIIDDGTFPLKTIVDDGMLSVIGCAFRLPDGRIFLSSTQSWEDDEQAGKEAVERGDL